MVGWNNEGLSGNNEDSDEKSSAEHGQFRSLFGNCVDRFWMLLHVRLCTSATLGEYLYPIFQCQLPGMFVSHSTGCTVL